MKLIDVDNFLKRYSNQVPGDTIDAIDLRLALLKEPKVEAIPVEWIKNEIGCSIGAVRDDDYDCDYDYAACILQLLDRWEKENGK